MLNLFQHPIKKVSKRYIPGLACEMPKRVRHDIS